MVSLGALMIRENGPSPDRVSRHESNSTTSTPRRSAAWRMVVKRSFSVGYSEVVR